MLDPALPPRQIVTSSDLVRHFGYWQDRAARTPVYILHRGRPRLVLTSVEIMDALCAPHSAGSGYGPELAAVLDRIEDRVLIVNDRHQIIAASDTARRHFGATAEDGRAVARIVPDDAQAEFAATLDRVARTGVPVALDLPARGLIDQDATLLIHAWPGGLMIVARDAANPSDTSDRAAFDEAIAASAGIAPVRIDLGGRVEPGQSTLADWSGLHAGALASVPFASLFDPASHTLIGEAVERVIRTKQALAINALLLANRPAPTAVRVGFAARRVRGVIAGVVAVLIVPADGDMPKPI
jgi:hypothetical protein